MIWIVRNVHWYSVFLFVALRFLQFGVQRRKCGWEIDRGFFEVQALTDANVFRFPSTFTFIFRELASECTVAFRIDESLFKFAMYDKKLIRVITIFGIMPSLARILRIFPEMIANLPFISLIVATRCSKILQDIVCSNYFK